MSVNAPIPEVPDDWEVIEAGEVCDVQNGFAFKSAYFNDKEGVPIIRIRDVHSGRSETLYSGPYDDDYVVDNGDLLVGMDGEFRICKWKAGKALLNQRVCRLMPKGTAMQPDFLYYSIGSPLKHIEDHTPFTTVKHIAARQIRAIPLPKPSLEEQQRIAQVLSTVQAAIEQQERLFRTTTELKQALMQKLFTEGLRDEAQKETEIGAVPESWEVVKVDDIADVRSGKRLPKGNALVAEDTGYPYIRVTDFDDNSVLVEQLMFVPVHIQPRIQRYIINKEDVYISVAGSIGIVGMVPPELDGVNLTENANRLVITDRKRIEPRYLMYWLDSERCQHEIKAQTLKNAQPKLGLGRIKTLPVALPSLDEQKDIIRALDAVRTKRQVAERKTQALRALFRTLLHELMTGKVRVGENSGIIDAHA